MQPTDFHVPNDLLKDVAIIFCDIDGTLLNEKSRLDPRTIAAVKRIAKRIPFILISGRSIPLMTPIHHTLGLTTPMIGANGAILSTALGETKAVYPFAKKDYQCLLTLMKDFGDVAINVYTEKQWFTNLKANAHVQKEENIVEQKASELFDLTTLENETITKLILMGEQKRLEKIQLILNEKMPHIRAYHNYANYIEIFAYEAEKGLAIHRYINANPLENGSIMAIGDSLIDASMFNYAKIKVAMNNAPEILKSQANIIAKANHEHGVAILLETMENL